MKLFKYTRYLLRKIKKPYILVYFPIIRFKKSCNGDWRIQTLIYSNYNHTWFYGNDLYGKTKKDCVKLWFKVHPIG